MTTSSTGPYAGKYRLQPLTDAQRREITCLVREEFVLLGKSGCVTVTFAADGTCYVNAKHRRKTFVLKP